MKTITILSTICLVLVSCSYFQEETKSSEPTQVVFVINDESASIFWDQKAENVRDQYLKKTLYKQIIPPADVIYMGVHSKSNSASNQRLIPWEEESVGTEPEQQKLQIITNLLSYFEISMSKKSEQQSSEIIELTAEIIRLSDQYKSVSLCLVGDMIQESSFRNFQKTPLTDKQTAERMAKNDARKLCKEYRFDQSAFKKVICIEILLPPDNLGMENMQHYYDAFYRTLGYENTIHWTVVR